MTTLPTLTFPQAKPKTHSLLEKFKQSGLSRTFSNPAIWRGMITERTMGTHNDPVVNNTILTRLATIEQSLRDGKELSEIPEFLEWLSGTQIWNLATTTSAISAP